MALPTTYTEQSFADWLRDGVLRLAAADLEWTTLASYQNIINDTLEKMRISDITQVTENDAGLLRAHGRVEAWRAVVAATVVNRDRSEGGISDNRRQIHENAVGMLRRAEDELAAYIGSTADDDPGTTGRSGPVQTVATW